MEDYGKISPKDFWTVVRGEKFNKPTSGVAKGYAQANLVILPKKYALDFMIFAQRNPKPCPIIDILEPGEITPPRSKGADIREDIPKYRIYREGVLASEEEDIRDLWQEDFVSFLLGCSFTFESALLDEGIAIKHMEQSKNVAMYQTKIPCEKGGIFEGNMVVSMRPFKGKDLTKVIQITSNFPEVHGAPIHIGNPEEIGIKDINKPEYGDPISIEKDEIPVFWACGVTPQLVALKAKPKIMITHAPGYMFVTDIKNEELSKD